MASDFIAGLIGGVAGVLVGHPFDTVKVRLQTQDAFKPKYKGTFHCFYAITTQESMLGLFKGMASPLLGLTFVNCILFGVQGNVMRLFEKPTLFSHWVAGSTAGAVQTIITGPMELAKTRMQMEGVGEQFGKITNQHYKGSVDALRVIYQQEGIRGCYRGYMLTLARDSPAFGTYFVSFEVYCRLLSSLSKDGSLGVSSLLLAGGSAGMTSWVSTYSVDVIKSRIQADGVNGENKYSGTWDAIRQCYRNEGIVGFHRGLGVTLLRAFPTNAAIFTVVTLSLRMINTSEEANGLRTSTAICKASDEKDKG